MLNLNGISSIVKKELGTFPRRNNMEVEKTDTVTDLWKLIVS